MALRILFVLPYAPTQIRVRPRHLIGQLVAQGHAVTLATLCESEEERAALAALHRQGVALLVQPLTPRRKAQNLLAALPSGRPLQADFCWHPALAAQMAALVRAQPFDVAHVEHLRAARYALALQRQPAAPPIVWDSVDSISHLFAQAARASRSWRGRMMARWELGRTRRYEGWLVRQFQRVLVTAPADAEALRRVAAARPAAPPIELLPNGVALDDFQPPTAAREPATLLFSGKMSYHANVSSALRLAQEIMPRVWQERPDARLCIVGRDPPAALRRLAVPGRIEVTGSVPDMRPFLQRATLAVAPMPYGAGIQNKVLEALACATPVVATPQGVAALHADGAEALVVAAEDGELARQIVALLADPDRRATLGAAGRRFVERHHSWVAIGARLAAIYQEMQDERLGG